ncbi:hypothetical protein FY150_15515 [Agrobacterium tumefaciens]|nr:hypothetical protein FY150_15515 [Agrobacterium tumefaciens]
MLFSTAEIIAVSGERPKNRHSGVLLPYRFMQIVDAEMFLIPFSQARDICCSEEYATNSNGSEFLPLCEKGRDVAPPRRQYQAGPLITPVSNRER